MPLPIWGNYMKTEMCWECDEFSVRGQKKTGYCNAEMKPTWSSVVKQCRDSVRFEIGDFCFFNCPFAYEMDGCLCEDAQPSVSNIDECPEFKTQLNLALGGSEEYVFLYVNDRAEIVEKVSHIWHGVYDWVNKELTLQWRWLAGWQRYYEGVDYA
jgi:hypothetical protein